LEKERQSERQMRLKLEEEYMQNTKNHEEEVQLRLKFESKLNNMHSAHRDLDTKYKRTQQDLAKALAEKDDVQEQLQRLLDQNTQLKTENTKLESQGVSLSEKVAGQARDLALSAKQKQELDIRNGQLMEELDAIKFQQQEQEKDMTANKLQAEMLASDNVALKNEKNKLLVELKETRKLQSVFEKKCTEQIEQLNQLKQEHQEARKQNIGADELAREREDRIAKLKAENEDLKQRLERLDIEYNTLRINHEKVTEQYDACAKELEDRSEMLHSTNKVRHETEIKLAEEIEKTRSLQDLVKLKEETLGKKGGELEELDKKVLELERQVEGLQIKYEGEKKSAELIKKQAAEKTASLNEMLAAEKETRDGWI
jgi:chromosome segregation ATPase